jgi:hypothetical protein
MKRQVLLLLAAALIYSVNAFAGTISGTVRDSADEKPLYRAMVNGFGFNSDTTFYTDTNGRFVYIYSDSAGILPSKSNLVQPNFHWNDPRQCFSWSGNSGQVSLKMIDTRGRMVAAFKNSSSAGEFRLKGLAASSYVAEIDFQGQKIFCRVLNISGRITAIKKELVAISGQLAKKTATARSLYVYKCGYIYQDVPVVGGEQGLIISLGRAVSFFPCPTDADTIRCLPSTKVFPGFSYGKWVVFQEGYDGSAHNCTHLETDCRWSIYDNHVGLNGTYQVISPDSSAIFVWSYATFSEFIATSKWRGCTKEGLMMGDSVARFIRLYPSSQSKYDSLQRTVSATLLDSAVYFNRLDTIWRAYCGDTIFCSKDTTYLDTTKKYHGVSLVGTEADFDSLSRMKRLTCYLWQKF